MGDNLGAKKPRECAICECIEVVQEIKKKILLIFNRSLLFIQKEATSDSL